MLQNKIYQNYLIEIFKTFFVILMGLSLIALTVRAVSFLELIVDSGYLLSTYFKFSLLNVLGIIPKFIPLSFLISLIFFVMKHKQDSEFVILWTSGVKKISIINLLVFCSFLVVILHLVASTFITPFSLKKASSRSQSSLVLFIDEKININNLKNHLSVNEFTYIKEISKSGETKKNIFIYEINSKRKIILVKNKKDTKTSEIESLGAEFYKIIKDIKFNEYSINSDSILNNLVTLLLG